MSHMELNCCIMYAPSVPCAHVMSLSHLSFQLGYIYENEAKQHMRGFLGIPGMAAEVKEKVHLLKEVIGALRFVLSLLDARGIDLTCTLCIVKRRRR